MTSISIEPIDQTYTITSVQISNIFIDIYSKSITIELNILDKDNHIVDKRTLVASGNDFLYIYDEKMLIEYVLDQLKFTTPLEK